MKFSPILVSALVAVALVGCSKEPTPPPVGPGDSAPVTKPSPTPTPTPAPTPGKGELPGPKPPAEAPPVAPTPLPENKNPKTFEVAAPGTGGYKPNNELTAAQLGQKVDEALSKLTNTLGYVTLEARTEENQGYNTCEVKIGQKGQYFIEYPRSEMIFERGLLVSDGKAKAVREQDKVTENVSNLVDKKTDYATEWSRQFTEFALLGLSDGRSIYATTMRDLSAGIGGYTTNLEKKQQTVNGRTFVSYRLLATRQTPNPTTIEIKIDGQRLLPVTLKVNRKSADGTELYARMAIAWEFNKKQDSSAFQVPKPVH